MKKQRVLVLLAAGMGSRYGGLKQIDPIDAAGNLIIDFSIYDAIRAGFHDLVFIIKHEIEQDFMDAIGSRISRRANVKCAFQEMNKLPHGLKAPEGRTKPLGTTHALLCARDEIGGRPFAVINSDDYYGTSAYRVIYDALCHAQDKDTYDYYMVGYELGKTVTDHGSVARGICVTDGKGHLTGIDERTRVEKYPGGIHFTEDGEHWVDVPADTTVSMNLWGYTPGFLKELEARFPAFLDKALAENPIKGEFFLPLAVSQLIAEKKATVTVLTSPDKWYGVTYAADKPAVVAALRRMTDEGKYPDGLWK